MTKKSTVMNAAAQVPLPPGSGLPILELYLARSGFWIGRRLIGRSVALKRFLSEARQIERLVRSQAASNAACPVLIPRIFGIEDSSRCWSLFMTLEHLVIVDTIIISILEHLTAGNTFGTEISTAAMKPNQMRDPEVVQRFSDTVSQYADVIASLPTLHTHVTHTHPWFGPLDAHGWHCLAALHHTIHRRQIERIIPLINRDSTHATSTTNAFTDRSTGREGTN